MFWPNLVNAAISIFAIIGAFAEGFSMSIIGPFFPTRVKAVGLNHDYIGILVAAMEISNSFGIFLFSSYINRRNQLTYYILGCLFSAAGIGALAFLQFINDPLLFFIFSLFFRVMHGLGASMIYSTAVAIGSNLSAKYTSMIIAIIYSLRGVGLSSGVVVGGILFYYFGFPMPFLAAASFLMLVAIGEIILSYVYCSVLRCELFPPTHTEIMENLQSYSGAKCNPVLKTRLVFIKTVKNYNFWLIGGSIFAIQTLQGLRDTVYALYFRDELLIEPKHVAFMFLPLSLAYIVGSPAYGYVTLHGYSAESFLFAQISAATVVLSFFSAHYYTFLHTPLASLLLIFLQGIAASGAFAPGFRLVERVISTFPFYDAENSKIHVSMTVNACISGGKIFGMLILGGIIRQRTDFFTTCLVDYILITSSIVASICAVFKFKLFSK